MNKSKNEAIVTKNVVGLYADRSLDSEQVTQAIMGQKVKIEKEKEDWLYVETWDAYHGWLQSRWVRRGFEEPKKIAMVTTIFTDAFSQPTPNQFDIKTKLVISTELELLEKESRLTHVRLLDGKDGLAVKVTEPRSTLIHVRLPAGDDAWILSACVRMIDMVEHELPLGPTGDEIVRTAKRFLGIPYLWGGASPFGIDCSGFVQLVYKLNGIRLQRDAGPQSSDMWGTPVVKSDLRAGDLVFFDSKDDRSRVNHVGIACGNGTFIHSTGGVGVGINSIDDDYFLRNYHSALRMI